MRCQIDVKTAFLIEELQEDVYMTTQITPKDA